MKIWDSSFELGDAVTEEQLAFFKEHGVIVFRNFLPKEQVTTYIAEQQRLEAQWLAEKKEKIKNRLKKGAAVCGERTRTKHRRTTTTTRWRWQKRDFARSR